jgi:ATP-dependent DNA helicase RecG
MAKRLEKLDIRTVRDLLYYVPFRYNDFSHTVPINRVRIGEIVTVEGEVQSIKNIFTKNGKKIQEAIIKDASGLLTVVWFNQLFLPKIIHQQDRIALSGTIGFFGNKVVMESPEYEIRNDDRESLHTGRFVPIYSETAGVSSKWLRGRIAHLLPLRHTFLQEAIPRTILETYHFLGISEAIAHVHFPNSLFEAEEGRKRLSFDELFYLQLFATQRKRRWEQEEHAPIFSIKDSDIQEFISHLPFVLTDDQQKAIRHISADVKRPYPMNRLLEGDVGSGKTVVAALAMYLSYINGYTSVLMAPTQILAEQHYKTIQQLLKPFGIPVQLVLGGLKGIKPKIQNPKSKQANNLQTTNQEQGFIYIGTHALLQEKVELHKVGLVVIDEQQRFGVSQRAIIRKKGTGDLTPHFFTMTATPIPRTLALTVYGNLDLSVLSEMPKGRTPIKTWVVQNEKRKNAYEWMRKELDKFDTRIFLVCPFIEESESMNTIKAAKKEFELLQKDIFPDIPIGLLHGKLKATEKTAILDAFRSGKTKILVTTPVVEVGIDIKEASIMVIEGADRFGLSQLHQLRGRVGRGDLISYCLLFTESTEPRTIARLKILETVKNGPELAEYDLNLRGEGDVFGLRQHGIPALALASLKDKELVEKAQIAVRTIVETDPNLEQFPLLRDRLEKGTIQDSSQD